MNEWVLLIIVLACLVVLAFLCGFIFAIIAKKLSPKVDVELDKLIDFEKQRGENLILIIRELTKSGFKFDKKAYKIISEGLNNLPNLDQNKRAEYKNVVDFCAMYLVKIYNEDKRYEKCFSLEQVEKLKKYQEESDAKYKVYNKKAAKYNAFLLMPFARTASKILKLNLQIKISF